MSKQLDEGRVSREREVEFGTKLLFGVTSSVSVFPVFVLEISCVMSGNTKKVNRVSCDSVFNQYHLKANTTIFL